MATNSAAPAAAGTTVDLSDVGDPTISTLWRRIYSHLNSAQVGQGMTVCTAFKQLLPPLVKRIELEADGNSTGVTQQQLQHIAATFTQLEELDISAECPDDQPQLDFGGLSLPCLTRLTLRCQPLRALNFTAANTPKLQSLRLESCGDVGSFHLQLPELQHLSVEHVEVRDERGLGRSLSSCPKLEMVSCYKLWGLGGTLHELRLPQCRELSFYRSDDLEGLKLWAPKLSELELRACYGLRCVRIMDDPPGSPLTPLQVNLINANIDPASKRHLKHHPRITAPGGKLITKERDDPRPMWFGDGEAGDWGDEDDDDDDDDDEGDGPFGGAGLGHMGGLAGMMAAGGGMNSMALMQMLMAGEGFAMGPPGGMHPMIVEMMTRQGVMHAGGHGPHPYADELEDGEEEHEEEDEWETDSGGGAEGGTEDGAQQQSQGEAPGSGLAGAHGGEGKGSVEGENEDVGDEAAYNDEDEDEDEDSELAGLMAGGLMAAMLGAGVPAHLAAVHSMAAVAPELFEDEDEGSDGEERGAGSPQCVIEEVG